jgi:PPOX class probable F420-dependent enzyme
VAELTDHARTLLEGPNFGFLAELMNDGSPHVSPVWVDASDGQVLVNTAKGRVKERNVRRDPRVAVSVMNAENPYDKVDIRGRVVETVDGAEAWDHIDALNRKYHRTDKPYPRRPGEERLILRIEPTVVHDGM